MITPVPGTLLIAEPFLKDPNFMRTVVFICEHQEDGSFGFVLNRLYEHSLNELMNNVDELNLKVYYGGPVQMDTIHFLHQYPSLIPNSIEVTKGIYWGGDFESAISLIRNGSIDTDRIRFFIGYSGWSAGQLTEELKGNSWLTVEATSQLVFHPKTEEIWRDSLKHLGGEYQLMANFPIDPQLN